MSDSSEETVLPSGLDEGLKEGLVRLRHVTQLTGAIHEAQMLQLKLWPRILFPCEQHTVEYDGDQRILTITMRLNGDLPVAGELVKLIETFESWCWFLLGPEWAIVLCTRKKIGRPKLLYSGKRKSPLPSPVVLSTEDSMRLVTEFRRYRSPDTKVAELALDDLGPLLGE